MGSMMIDKYIIQGQPFDDSTAMEFLFLGANIDAVKEADRFGIEANRAVTYHCDSVGTEIKPFKYIFCTDMLETVDKTLIEGLDIFQYN